MQRFRVLVTAMHLAPEAHALLAGAGAELAFMAEPIDEDALIAQFDAAPTAAVILRGSKPFTSRVLAAAGPLKIIAKNGAGELISLAGLTDPEIITLMKAFADQAEHDLGIRIDCGDVPREHHDALVGLMKRLITQARAHHDLSDIATPDVDGPDDTTPE